MLGVEGKGIGVEESQISDWKTQEMLKKKIKGGKKYVSP